MSESIFEPAGGFPNPEPDVERTDLGNARLFAFEHGERFRYVVARRQWLAYTAGRWRRDEDDAVVRAAKDTVEGILRRAIHLDGDERKAAIRHALASQSEPAIRRMLALAGSEQTIALTPQKLDADPWLLSCANGVLDLRTGELRDHDPADLISLGNNIIYEPNADCPRWRRFLLEVFDGDTELVEFIQRAIGYTLTGDTREHVLFVLRGAGANGKTTLTEIVKLLLGDLAATAAFDTFARTRGDRGPRNDLARLHRARYVSASESGEGRRLDEATMKTLTGGDTVAARFLYGEHFEFRPDFKIWLATNHAPRVDGGDDAIWRRLRLIPFEVSFRGREDRELRATLETELPGILAWSVQGCLQWQRDGLGTAPAVEQATGAYREDEDVLGAFLAERCDVHPENTIDAADLRQAFEEYCHELGEKPMAANVLGRQLARRGIRTDVPTRGHRVYIGLRLHRITSSTSSFGNSPRVRAHGEVSDSASATSATSADAREGLAASGLNGSPNGTPRLGDDGYLRTVRGAYRRSHLTHAEYLDRVALHGLIVRAAATGASR